MKTALVYLRPTRIAYVRVTGSYQRSVPEAWDRMLGWLEKNGLSSPVGRGFGMMRDNPYTMDPETCRYDACIELNPFIEERAIRELGAQTLPGGSYLRTRHVGDYGHLRASTVGFYENFDSPKGLRFDDRRPLVTIYLDDPRRFAPEELRADVCVPVTAHAKRTAADEMAAA